MKNLKITGVLLMMLAAVMLLSGCHSIKVGSDYMEVPSVLDETRIIELSFWAKNDSNKSQIAVYTKAIEDFEKLYPNIRINLRSYTKYDDIYADVIKNTQTGTQANICVTYPDHIATYMDSPSKPVLQLDNWMRDSRYGLGGSELRFDSPKEPELVPEFLSECVLDGHYYAIPYMRSTEALYINQDMVEKLGYEVPDVVTWDFIWEVSEKAMEKNEDGTFKINGKKVLIPVIYKSTDNMMITMLKQMGAPYSTEYGEVQLFNSTTKSIMQDIFLRSKNKLFSTFTRSSYPGNFLNREECIFAIDSTAGATWMGGDAPLQDIPDDEQVSFRVAVRPVPQIDPENVLMISQGPSLCIFTRQDSQEVLASWLFVQYLLSDDVQISYAQTEGYLPVTLKAQQNEKYREYLSRKGEDNNMYYTVKIEASELLMNHMADTFVTAVFNGSTSLRSAAGQLIEEAVNKGYRDKTMTVMTDDDAEALFRKIIERYRLDEIKVKTRPLQTTEENKEDEGTENTPGQTEETEKTDGGNQTGPSFRDRIGLGGKLNDMKDGAKEPEAAETPEKAENQKQSFKNKIGLGGKLNDIQEEKKEPEATEAPEKTDNQKQSFKNKIGLGGKLNGTQEKAEEPEETEKPEDTGEAEAADDTEDDDNVMVASAKDMASGDYPPESKALLIGLPAVWAVLGGTTLVQKGKERRKKKKTSGKN